jgi:protein subunit release factor B
MKDCEMQTFRSGGHGGQNQNKRDTGVRIIHKASGAVGEARDERSQLQNKRLAFRRMAESARFQSWAQVKATGIRPIDEIVEEMMAEDNLLIEYLGEE